MTEQLTREPIKHGQQVRHKKRELHEARFYGWSKSGKKIGVHHDIFHPHGVYAVTYFDPESIEPVQEVKL